MSENQSDVCPHCQSCVDISFLELALRITAKVSTCPNCGIVAAVRAPSAKSKGSHLVGSIPNLVGTPWRGSTMFETLNARFRRVLVSLIAAVFVAAVLRHVLHVYGWIPREDIRIGALIALAFAVLFYVAVSAIRWRR
jgi:predicted RNA-binding Zn-ribbon protein involved in translation (DUF1610 family)